MAGGPVRLPLVCRTLIGAAALLVPRDARAAWLGKWRGGAAHWWAFLHEREEFLIRDGYRQLVRHCAGAFLDAFWVRFRRDRLRDLVRGPAFVLMLSCIALGAIAAGSGGFRTLRTVRPPSPYPDASRLVTVTQDGPLGRAGIPAAQVRRWSGRVRKLAGIAAFRAAPYRPAFATPNLFTVLGVRPVLGRVFTKEDERFGQNAAMLSYDHWRAAYRGDPGIVGRTIAADHDPMTVIGVLPPTGRMPGLPDAPLWTLTDRDYSPPPRLFHVVARLAPGVTAEQAARELWAQAAAEKVRLIQGLRLGPFRPAAETTPLLAIPCFGLVIGMVLVAIDRRSPVAGHVSNRRRLRCWGFLVLKSVLVFGALTLFWIEAFTGWSAGPAQTEMGELVTVLRSLIPTLAFIAACALAMLWCVADQRRRCPECLSRLALPVSIGSWSNPLLDPVTTEFVCPRGHGSMAMPETHASSADEDRWTAMDESWRDLFTRS